MFTSSLNDTLALFVDDPEFMRDMPCDMREFIAKESFKAFLTADGSGPYDSTRVLDRNVYVLLPYLKDPEVGGTAASTCSAITYDQVRSKFCDLTTAQVVLTVIK